MSRRTPTLTPGLSREIALWCHQVERVLKTLENLSAAAAGQSEGWKRATMLHYQSQYRSLIAAMPPGAEDSRKAYEKRYGRL